MLTCLPLDQALGARIAISPQPKGCRAAAGQVGISLQGPEDAVEYIKAKIEAILMRKVGGTGQDPEQVMERILWQSPAARKDSVTVVQGIKSLQRIKEVFSHPHPVLLSTAITFQCCLL